MGTWANTGKTWKRFARHLDGKPTEKDEEQGRGQQEQVRSPQERIQEERAQQELIQQHQVHQEQNQREQAQQEQCQRQHRGSAEAPNRSPEAAEDDLVGKTTSAPPFGNVQAVQAAGSAVGQNQQGQRMLRKQAPTRQSVSKPDRQITEMYLPQPPPIDDQLSRQSVTKEDTNGLPHQPPGHTSPLSSHLWDQHVGQSADDGTIRKDVKTLFELIEEHVNNFYTSRPVQSLKDAPLELSDFQTPYISFALRPYMVESQHRLPAIKHCLTYMIVSAISLDQPSRFPLLPNNFSASPPNQTGSAATRGIRHLDLAYRDWKILCRYLWPDVMEDRTYIAHRERVIGEFVAQFSRAFMPWQRSAETAVQRDLHLSGLLEQAAKVGHLLFTQPSTFKFDWQIEGTVSSTWERIAIWPRIFKETNQAAERLDPRPILVKMETWSTGLQSRTDSHRTAPGLPADDVRPVRDVSQQPYTIGSTSYQHSVVASRSAGQSPNMEANFKQPSPTTYELHDSVSENPVRHFGRSGISVAETNRLQSNMDAFHPRAWTGESVPMSHG